MKYKQLPFNMTLAKRISDGSVHGRILVIGKDENVVGNAKYLREYGSEYEFSMVIYTGTEEMCKEIQPFDEHGIGGGDFNKLVIEIPVEDSYDEEVTGNSFVEQEKDTHYHKCKIEPIDYILANNLGFCEGNVVKYITRYKDKGGIDDLRKIKVYVDYLIDDLTKDDNA